MGNAVLNKFTHGGGGSLRAKLVLHAREVQGMPAMLHKQLFELVRVGIFYPTLS